MFAKILYILLMVAFSGTSLLVYSQAKPEDKSVSVKLVKQLPAKEKRWALIIGIDNYEDENISDLRGAANDARTLAVSLEQYAGFANDQIILLTTSDPKERQPTRANILKKLSIMKGLVPKDGLLMVSFSGHGIERGGRAFLIPSDATSTDDVDLLEETAISVESMRNQVRNTRVQQVLFLLDACRNDPTSGRSDSSNPLTSAYTKGFSFDVKNKEIEAFATLYATSVGARAYEYSEKRQGYFSWAIAEGLSGKAANENGEVTLGGLVRYISQRVPKMVAVDLGVSKVQRPFAVIEGYNADDLVLASNENRVSGFSSSQADANVSSTGDEVFWQEVSRRNTFFAYQAYLTEYPKGKYAAVARLKIDDLQKEETQRTKDTEKQKWQEAEKLNTIQSYQNYLSAYPAGEYKSVANFRIGDLKAKAEVEKLRSPLKGDTITRPLGTTYMEFAGIPKGSYVVNRTVDGKSVQEEYALPTGLWMGKYEVTRGQWYAVMGRYPENCSTQDQGQLLANMPVVCINWNEANEFISKLNEKKDGLTYFLPSDNEWGYAARAGTGTKYYWGEDAKYENICKYANVFDVSGKPDPNSPIKSANCDDGMIGTAAVGKYLPNEFGLYDMIGNVWEWTSDTSPSDQNKKAFRGGSWDDNIGCVNSYHYHHDVPTGKYKDLGFRVAARLN